MRGDWMWHSRTRSHLYLKLKVYLLPAGSIPVYKMMPAFDPSFPLPGARTQPFRVGRLDTTAANGGGLCASFEAQRTVGCARCHPHRSDVW
jgi:hypothetical protein